MSQMNDETRQALAARVQFYKELGINSFYRRGDAPGESVNPLAATESDEAVLPIIQAVSGDKTAALDSIRADIGDCTRCRLHKGRNQLVFGTGSANADIMFVGEGPGADEDEQGLPFV